MFRALVWLVIIGIVGAIGFDYVKGNIDIDEKIDELAAIIDETLQEQTTTVTVEPLNSEIVPVDTEQTAQPSGVIKTTAELTEALLYHLQNYENHFTLEFKGDTAQLESMINEAYQQVERLNPYVYGHLSDRNIEYSYTARRATLNFQQNYLTTLEQERYVNGKVEAILNTIQHSQMDDFEKVKFVNDYIVQNTRYSEETNASPHSAYAILFEGKGVCQGYALLAYKMLAELGVENLYVTGQVADGGHAWNLVKLKGNWYHLDTTWNDPVPDRGKGISYNYFLVSDQQLQQDHAWDLSKYPRATTKHSF